MSRFVRLLSSAKLAKLPKETSCIGFNSLNSFQIMVSITDASLVSSSPCGFSNSRTLPQSTILAKQTPSFLLSSRRNLFLPSLPFKSGKTRLSSKEGLHSIRFFNTREKSESQFKGKIFEKKSGKTRLSSKLGLRSIRFFNIREKSDSQFKGKAFKGLRVKSTLIQIYGYVHHIVYNVQIFKKKSRKTRLSSKQGLRSIRFFSTRERSGSQFKGKESGLEWSILRRWEVPWEWQMVSLTSAACGMGFVFAGVVEAAAVPYLGIQLEELSLDEKAEILLVHQSITTAVVLGVLYSVAKTYQPLPEDLFKYDLREPFNLRKGWLLWAGVGLAGALIANGLTGAAISFFSGETPQRTDVLVRLLPLIGFSNISTACLVGVTGVLAPLLEETVFRGFFMTSLTKWVPTPVAVVISAAVFALAHLTQGKFPQLFVLGTALGISYAQTRNLLTPITIHAFWNSGIILLLTFLQLQGYDIKELLQKT